MLATRRSFLRTAAAGALALAAAPRATFAAETLWPISLAQWSLHRSFFGRPNSTKRDPADFAKIAKTEFGIDAIEYVNQFYKDKKTNEDFLKDLKKRAEDNGVRSVLIMCDGEGRLGDPDEANRKKAVENHYRWIEWAKFLGCHSIRVNASSAGAYDEQVKLAADGLRKLSEFGATHEINVIVENHGGLSSNGEWLAKVMKAADHPRCGTLPDFGNFRINKDETYDRYKGVTELMPFAKGVSAKTHDFNDMGDEVNTDYRKMMKIVLDAGYKGHVGIEYEGGKISEEEGIKLTKKLLETVRAELSAK